MSILLDRHHFVVLVPAKLVDHAGPDEALARFLEAKEVYGRDEYEILDAVEHQALYREAVDRARQHVKRRGGKLMLQDRHEGSALVITGRQHHRVFVRVIRTQEPQDLKPEPSPTSFDPEIIS